MDINDRIAEHRGLVYAQLARFKLLDDQDAESYAYEALYRAIQTYNDKAGAVFSTYAVCVISNALRKHIRTLNRKRQLDVVSYYDMLSGNSDSAELIDVIPLVDESTDAEAIVMFNELRGAVGVAFRKVLKAMPTKQQLVISTWYSSDYKLTQSELAKALNISQPTVSKALSVFKYRLKLELEEYM